MKRILVRFLSLILLFSNLGFMPSGAVQARGPVLLRAQQTQPTPGELIGAVNDLRLAYGLPALKVNSILMYVAQSQADYLLATQGGSGHGRPNGMSLTEQLLSLGYPLGGDLSLGGYRSENFVFGSGDDVQGAVHAWLGDDAHTNTMLSPNYLDIGGGVAIGSDGTVYYVIDTARPTASGKPQEYTPAAPGTVVSGATVNGTLVADQFMVPVALSTPNSGGLVIHEVRYGQTLWSLAIAYNTTIKQIRDLNNLPSNDIYADQKLLIRREAIQTAPALPSPESNITDSPTFLPDPDITSTRTATPVPLFPGSDPKKDNLPLIMVSIFATLGLAGLGFWANKKRN
jgi:LysM repeat protein